MDLNDKFIQKIIFLLVITSIWAQKIKPVLIQEWAKNFGKEIYDISAKSTSLDIITQSYIKHGATITKLDGLDVVQTMANKIEAMLQSKVEAVKRLVDTAEEAYKEHSYDKNIDISYFNAKEVLDANSAQAVGTGDKMAMVFKPHEQFDNIPVNLSLSTIHVPTNVYNKDNEVLNGISWSEKLNKVFVDNYNRDRTLMWQYFGSETGFFRLFPGLKWEFDKNKIDLYDCRVKDWYIQAATSPKDLVILLDGSGSMTGLRIEIAKLAIETIMNTLSDDDFFNVIQFTAEIIFIESCFNDTLVQGNEDNKNKIKEQLENIYPKEIARFDIALMKAFELLKESREKNRGTNCNQAIMIITDGAPEDYSEIFLKYNPDKQVRVFTYLIGRETTESQQLKSMSCNNKGFFTHIATLADVQENVQEYIKVISRPMVIEQEHVTIWTGIYHTKADPKTKNWLNLLEEEMNNDQDTIRLMTSVAQPVFDRKNTSYGEGNLLGVMGTDVPIEEIIKLTPQYKLGPNGYPFGITNNGYILFHPDLRPLYGKFTKPNYNSVDLSEVEFSDEENPLGRNYEMRLRKDMLDQKTANHTMAIKMAYDIMRRVELRRNHYFYTTLMRTPFSLGIALPDDGLYTVKGMMELTEVDVDRDFAGTLWRVVPDWVYCRLPNEENKHNDRSRLKTFVRLGQASYRSTDDKFQDAYRFYTENCDKDLMMSLAFDAKVTSPILKEWQANAKLPFTRGTQMVFIGTRSGLTRFYEYEEKDGSLDNGDRSKINEGTNEFIERHSKALEELYYKRADTHGPGYFVFSVEHNNFPDYSFTFDVVDNDTKAAVASGDSSTGNGTLQTSPSPNSPTTNNNNKAGAAKLLGPPQIQSNYFDMMVTGSSPIAISSKNGKFASGENDKSSATAAVVGIRMKLDRFAQIFYNTSTINCFTEGAMCYVLDEHAYVILSSAKDPRHIGKYFGQIDGRTMLTTVNNHVYKRIELYDFQAMCETQVPLSSSSLPTLNNIIMNPVFRRVSNWITFYLHIIISNLCLIWNHIYLLCETKVSTTPILSHFWDILYSAFEKHRTLLFFSTFINGNRLVHTAPAQSEPNGKKVTPTTSQVIIEEVEDEDDNSRIKVFKPPHHCEKKYNLLTVNRRLLESEGPISLISNCGGSAAYSSPPNKYDKLRFCGKPFTVSLVPHTNLVLIVVRKAQSGFFADSNLSGGGGGSDRRNPPLAQGSSSQGGSDGKGGGGTSSQASSFRDICSLCDDLTLNYQPKGVSLIHEEVRDMEETDDGTDMSDGNVAASMGSISKDSSASNKNKDEPLDSDEDESMVGRKGGRRRRRRNRCYGIKTHVYRRRPTTCYSHNSLENSDICGSAVTLYYGSAFHPYKSILITLSTILVTYYTTK